MLRKFIEDSPISNKYDFDFIPVGYNLGFEHKFLLEIANSWHILWKQVLLTNVSLYINA